jgi:hypothetical protein
VSILISIGSFILFAIFAAQHIPAGDSGDLVTAAATLGVAHPPGYPLYTLLGWILSHVPLSTIVWRIGLLSSVTHAVVVYCVYRVVYRLTRRKTAAAISTFFCVGNYLFFLYSITPEVFALLDLCIVAVIWCLVRFVQTKGSPRYVYLLSFTLGLSLSHHHMIFFLFPAALYVLWHHRQPLVKRISLPRILALFCLGIVPYLYVPFAARGGSMVNWNHATTIQNFIALVTRADYGTFQSGAIIGVLPLQRLIQVQAYIQYLILDFSWVGIVLALAGLMFLFHSYHSLFWFFVIALVSLGPLFFFYASFPLANRFSLATYERFLLPSYICIFVLIGCGFSWIVNRLLKAKRLYWAMGIVGMCFVYSGVTGAITIWKFVGYGSDETAQNVAVDILSPLPKNSVVLLNRDTMLFTAQYMRYVEHMRPDVAVIHANRLGNPDYQETVRGTFPYLRVSGISDAPTFTQFLESIAAEGRLFSTTQYAVDSGWYWVPYGLMYRLVWESDVSSIQSMLDEDSTIWQSLHNPSDGILSHHNHLMLSDVRDIYTTARVEFGQALFRAKEFDRAKREFEMAIAYGGDTDEARAYLYLGLCELMLRDCDSALVDIRRARDIAITPMSETTYAEALVWQDCVGDRGKAAELFDQYEHESDTTQILLEEL